ncbi:MAG: Npun_F0494 family protein [Spirulinaceae cyanobacterium]
MTSTPTQVKTAIQYSPSTIKRAEKALCCSPFHLALFATMAKTSVPISAIASHQGYQASYTKKILSESTAQSNLAWLIQVGLLRREVDGQGITDSFRLTPLGRQLVAKWENLGGSWPEPSWLDRIINAISRWVRLPI